MPATLLAMQAHLRGSGALALFALDVAIDADPDNVLARLLTTVLGSGIAPDEFRWFCLREVTAFVGRS
jgi:hypothetical protein